MRTTLIALTLLIPVFCSAQGALDGYMKGKGHIDFALTYSSNRSQVFQGAENVKHDAPFKGSTLALFAEWGVTDRLDLVATIPAVFTADQSGLQDGGFYVKYRPVYAQFKSGSRLGILGGMGISLPLSDYEPLATGAIGQKATVAQPRLILQYETKSGLFFNLTGGYNFRLDDLSQDDIDVVRMVRPNFQPEDPVNYSTFLFKVGFPAAKYYVDAWVERQMTSGGTDYVPNLIDLPQAYGVDYTQVGGTVYFTENGKVGYVISSGCIFDGRNTSLLFRLTGGLIIKI